jgi:lipoyl(octanoyl) transferase
VRAIMLLEIAELGTVDYRAALRLQEALVAARIGDQTRDTLLLLEHPHVFTLGRGADERFVRDRLPEVPIFRVSRGGQVTYHGPGQLVGYPILKLEGGRRDVGRYLRDLEQVIIDALAPMGIAAGRRERMTGVWIGARKIASIGVGIRRWVSCHGFALNVAPDLSYFNAIVPCGIEGCEMTSIALAGRAGASMREVAAAITGNFARVFGYDQVTSVTPEEIWARVDPELAIAEARNQD